ncbi:UPF0235 protein [Iodidimonas muriae]|uniref:UPF0235 protein GCM10007972_08520 n=1 Tax=Iodidimonas muriae TaxID=261467 RepID=A0ABQ2LA39_9PROT|nr:DUF167 family protein [Iodidimonas muriae]GER06119.1 UPF0235 protein [Kordiimonadales bacterium JCM 17843]GGO08294.1 UPF0235 protein [Iodidimonas muriae]
MTASSPCFTAIEIFDRRPDGVRFSVKLTPKAASNMLDRVELDSDGAARLRVCVTVAPEKGKANKALIALLAKEFSLPKSTIHIQSGDTARLKTLHIDGDPDHLIDQLSRAMTRMSLGI